MPLSLLRGYLNPEERIFLKTGLGRLEGTLIGDGNRFGPGEQETTHEMPRESALQASTWQVLTFDPGTGTLGPPLPGTSVTAEFQEEGRLTGSAGCNRYGTTYETKGSTMTVNPLIAVTQMWCGDPEGLMAQEDAFLKAWGRVSAYRMEKELLELTDAEGAVILVFAPAPSKGPG